MDTLAPHRRKAEDRSKALVDSLIKGRNLSQVYKFFTSDASVKIPAYKRAAIEAIKEQIKIINT